MTRYFLDMNLPIYYCMQFGHPLEKKAKEFIEMKDKNIFLLCDYIYNRNLPRWLKRQKIILFEFNQKIQNDSYALFSSKNSSFLFPKDKLLTKKLFFLYQQSNDKREFIQDINNLFSILPNRVSVFIKKFIDEIVIPEKEIDFELKSCLNTWLRNDSDAYTIASAIQEHNKKDKGLTIITADIKDWNKELLEEIHNDIYLKKKYLKLPPIKYLQNI